MSKPLQIISFLSFTGILCLVLLEVSLRVVMPIRHWFPEGMFISDPDSSIGYKLAPEFDGSVKTMFYSFDVHIDEDGHRLSGSNTDKRGSLVGFFGDSFMFGQGVDDNETVPAYVGQDFAPQNGVLNAGVYGYTPYQEFRMYKRLGDIWPIETVVLQLGINDVVIQGERIKRGVYRGFLNADPPTDPAGRVKNWFFSHFEIVAHVRRLVYSLGSRNTVPGYLQTSFEYAFKEEIASTKNLLIEWAEETKRRNQRFLIYFVPTVVEMDYAFENQRKQWIRIGGKYDPEVSYRWLRQLCENESSMEFVDIVKVFKKSYDEGGPGLYIVKDGHTNSDGNRVIAEAIRKTLSTSSLD